MGLFSFITKNTNAGVAAQANQKIEHFQEQRDALEQARQQKMQRQVELWSIMNLPPDLEAEYKEVSSLIAVMVKQVAAYDAHLKKLRLEKFHCQNGSCEVLLGLLTIEDPWAERVSEGTEGQVPATSS